MTTITISIKYDAKLLVGFHAEALKGQPVHPVELVMVNLMETSLTEALNFIMEKCEGGTIASFEGDLAAKNIDKNFGSVAS